MCVARFATKTPQEYMLIKNILRNHRGTNPVRHCFKDCSNDEAIGAIFIFNEFAKMYKLPNQQEIDKLAQALDVWLARKSPVETAAELEKAIMQIKTLSEQNEDMLKKVTQLGEVQTSRARNEEEQKNLKVQKELQVQLEKLSDAEEYIQNLNRMTSYTRTRYDFEQSIVHLTREQESIVNQVKFNRDFLIKGSAGTGKSLVLLKTLEKLLAEQSGSLFESDRQKTVKLITFTHSLEKYNR